MNAAFLGVLQVGLMTDSNGFELKNKSGDQLWILEAPLLYVSDLANVSVPKGFITDFASVPHIPFVYDTLANMAQRPATVHDYLYSMCVVPRDIADKVLLEAMEISGVSWLKRRAIYLGVRVGGASHYKKG